ncbi:bZIP transcription factor [Legionella clemsonensis]|uniref:BZIP domain-containing protein n=1 Tax=Legionella clemsonensis TaxID=1867846 RepID=A0A222P453_9GAMM|nr:bZIP transcription factor [Legionella clemsonensis]ASQ46612.1 hypothetical protein clem_10330 [Legionella clemsonensis]
MLEFYLNQQTLQDTLLLLIEQSLQGQEKEREKNQLLVLLHNQKERLNFLIDAEKNRIEVNLYELLKDYSNAYSEQQKILEELLGTLAKLWLPPLNVPGMALNELTPPSATVFSPPLEPLFPEMTSYPGTFFSFAPVLIEQPQNLQEKKQKEKSSFRVIRSSCKKTQQPSPEENQKLYEALKAKKMTGTFTLEDEREFQRLTRLISAKEYRERKKRKLLILKNQHKALEAENKELALECIQLQTENRVLQEELDADRIMLESIASEIIRKISTGQNISQTELLMYQKIQEVLDNLNNKTAFEQPPSFLF